MNLHFQYASKQERMVQFINSYRETHLEFPKCLGSSKCFLNGRPTTARTTSSIKEVHSCLLNMDNSHGPNWSWLNSQFTISCPLVQGSSKVYSLMLFFGLVSLFQWLDMPRVMTSLVTGCFDSLLQEVCHVSSFGWSHRFRCQILLPINSRVPLLPFTFLKFSPLTFLVQHLIQEYSSILSLPLSRARYSLHPRSQVFKFQNI